MPDIPIRSALPEGALALLAEYFLLDPGNAAVLAAAAGISADAVTHTLTAHDPGDYTGTLPARGLAPWSQPWQPLFVEWRAHYLPIPYAVNSRRCWTFDGTDYRYVPGSVPDTPAAVEVSGISGLSPHPRTLFADRLKKFVTDHGTSEQLGQLDHWLSAIGGWGFLAQEMTGFNDYLAGRDSRTFRRPMSGDATFPEIADLAGYPDAATAGGLPARYRGRVTSVPYLPDGNSPDFQETPFVIDDAFSIESALHTSIASVAQLPPRPLQPARLDFDLLDGRTGSRVVGADRNLSVLVGRPLALVPAQLRLSLDGAPLFDSGWGATLDPPAPAFTGYEFAVRLGDQFARDDGLIGYFTTGSDGAYRFDRFNSVTAPDDQQQYVTQIGALEPRDSPADANYPQLTFGDAGPTKLLLLMDPRADVHAVTGIVPTVQAGVAPSHVETPLDRIETLFRFGPIMMES